MAIRAGEHAWADYLPSAEAEACVKVFLGRLPLAGGDCLLLGQMSPPVVGMIPVAEVAALHKVVGRCGFVGLPPTGPVGRDRAALELIAQMAYGGAVVPVNPGWLRRGA